MGNPMSIVLQSSGGGSVTINEPTTASNFTQTLPASDGTVMVSGNMPSFASYIASNFSLPNSTYTKVGFDTKDWDTANCYNTSTYRYTPNVAGYYQFNVDISFNTGQSTEVVVALYKNGSAVRYMIDFRMTTFYTGSASNLVYANGTTDYFEVYVYQISGGSTLLIGGQNQCSFQGFLARTA
jgi:hypothetical protein